MMRGLLALVIWLGLAASAQAQHPGGGFAGYIYPSTIGVCSPACTGASVSLTIPPGLSGASILYAWVGIQTDTGDGVVCAGSCLGQFGFQYVSGALSIWWELACVSGGTGCNGKQTITGFSVSAGDTLALNMVCTSVTCNGSTAETWAVTLTDKTTNAVCILHNATTCGTSGQTMNWPLSLGNFAYYVYELDGIVTWSSPGHWAGATYTQGNPGSQTTFNTPLGPSNNLWTVGSGAGASKSASASGPVGPNGNDFNICSPVTSATFTACGASWYGPAPALGP